MQEKIHVCLSVQVCKHNVCREMAPSTSLAPASLHTNVPHCQVSLERGRNAGVLLRVRWTTTVSQDHTCPIAVLVGDRA